MIRQTMREYLADLRSSFTGVKLALFGVILILSYLALKLDVDLYMIPILAFSFWSAYGTQNRVNRIVFLLPVTKEELCWYIRCKMIYLFVLNVIWAALVTGVACRWGQLSVSAWGLALIQVLPIIMIYSMLLGGEMISQQNRPNQSFLFRSSLDEVRNPLCSQEKYGWSRRMIWTFCLCGIPVLFYTMFIAHVDELVGGKIGIGCMVSYLCVIIMWWVQQGYIKWLVNSYENFMRKA